MKSIRNVALERLGAGEVALGAGLRQARGVDIGRIMRTCGYDWLFIDMEHNAMSVDDAVAISIAAADAGIAPIVRVPDLAHHHATRVLDGGAQGIIVPHVETAADARRVVANCTYPPAGHRSVSSALPQVGFDAVPLAEACAAINASTLITVMLETPGAIENAEEIAAVPGLHVLFIGTSDLTMEMGIPGEVGHARIVAAYQRVLAAAGRHGLFVGMGGVGDVALMRRYIDMGVRLVLAGSDLSFMMAAARERARALRG